MTSPLPGDDRADFATFAAGVYSSGPDWPLFFLVALAVGLIIVGRRWSRRAARRSAEVAAQREPPPVEADGD